MSRYRTHTTTTCRTTCHTCEDWVCYDIALNRGQEHVMKTGHIVTRRLVKETTLTPYSRPGTEP